MIVPSERNKAIILLCKGRHKKKSNLEAIRLYLAQRYGFQNPEELSGSSVYHAVLDTLNELASKEDLQRLIHDLFERQVNLHYNDVIQQMIAAIADYSVQDEQGNVLIALD